MNERRCIHGLYDDELTESNDIWINPSWLSAVWTLTESNERRESIEGNGMNARRHEGTMNVQSEAEWSMNELNERVTKHEFKRMEWDLKKARRREWVISLQFNNSLSFTAFKVNEMVLNGMKDEMTEGPKAEWNEVQSIKSIHRFTEGNEIDWFNERNVMSAEGSR